MTPYFIIFFVFCIIAFLLKFIVIDNNDISWLSLIGLGFATIIPLLSIYFLFLFMFTSGMKYFVARSPKAYHYISRINNIKEKSNNEK